MTPDRTRIIAVGAHKGGVGKTTISNLLATGLANAGYRVALVDLDAQSQVCEWFGMAESPSLWRMLVDEVPPTDLLYPVPDACWRCENGAGELLILPADVSNQEVWNHCPDALKLRHALLAMLARVDYVILDTPPSISEHAVGYLLAAGRLIIPTEPSYLSIRSGVQRTMETVNHLRQQTLRMPGGGVDLEVIGIIPNRVDRRRKLHKVNLAELKKFFPGLVWPPLNDLVAYEESPQSNQCIWNYCPQSPEVDVARVRAAGLLARFLNAIGANNGSV